MRNVATGTLRQSGPHLPPYWSLSTLCLCVGFMRWTHTHTHTVFDHTHLLFHPLSPTQNNASRPANVSSLARVHQQWVYFLPALLLLSHHRRCWLDVYVAHIWFRACSNWREKAAKLISQSSLLSVSIFLSHPSIREMFCLCSAYLEE